MSFLKKNMMGRLIWIRVHRKLLQTGIFKLIPEGWIRCRSQGTYIHVMRQMFNIYINKYKIIDSFMLGSILGKENNTCKDFRVQKSLEYLRN